MEYFPGRQAMGSVGYNSRRSLDGAGVLDSSFAGGQSQPFPYFACENVIPRNIRPDDHCRGFLVREDERLLWGCWRLPVRRALPLSCCRPLGSSSRPNGAGNMTSRYSDTVHLALVVKPSSHVERTLWQSKRVKAYGLVRYRISREPRAMVSVCPN
jgi:hypothetical protein